MSRHVRIAALFLLLAVAVAALGCRSAPVDPPPAAAQAIFEHVREGYRLNDADLFTQDFGAVMFTRQGPEYYLEVIDTLKSRFGEWGEDEETYLGAEDSTHTWRIRLGRNLIRLVIVLDEDDRVQGLWFR